MSGTLNIIKDIVVTDEFQVLLKLILTTILSGIIGFEREHLSKPAGFRTHVLVGISSALVMICNIGISELFGSNDASRMPAQLLSGIGFIGAGTILSNGFKVKGLTTAAGLLSVTCIGLSVGAGMYVESILTTLVVYIVLRYPYNIGNKSTSSNNIKFKITATKPKELLSVINDIIINYEMGINKVSIEEKEDDIVGNLHFDCTIDSSFDKNHFFTDIAKIGKVKDINEEI